MELIAAIAQGDRKAFAALYEEFKDRVYNTVLGHLQNEADAEEVTQDVFVEIFRSAKSFGGNSAVSTWIYRIAVNKALDRIRYNARKKRFAPILRLVGGGDDEGSSIDPPTFDHPGVLMEQREHAALLFAAIRALPATQQTAFILVFMESLPQQEVADIMDLTVKAVESLLQRAKSSLRAELQELHEGRRKSRR